MAAWFPGSRGSSGRCGTLDSRQAGPPREAPVVGDHADYRRAGFGSAHHACPPRGLRIGQQMTLPLRQAFGQHHVIAVARPPQGSDIAFLNGLPILD
jgi:hypothetical protein